MKPASLIGLLVTTSFIATAQMTAPQRELDFQALASLYAKRYAPANWKFEALGVNIFELKPWMDQVKATKTDVEYFEVCSRFVASLQDGHTGFSTPSNFIADLGIYVDVFDNRILIETIVRTRYPAAQFPFQAGDELVSIDGKPVEEIISELEPQQSYSNPRTTRRAAADAVTFRRQSEYPRAVDLPDQSQVVVRRASGDTETYQLTWLKTGTELRNIGRVPTPTFARSSSAVSFDPKQLYDETHNWSVSGERYFGRLRDIEREDGEAEQRSFVTGWGSRFPYYILPAGFQMRLGNGATDPFFTGTFTSGDKRIGLIRIPNFSVGIPLTQYLALLDAEVDFFRANTDGLVVDLSRNTGGGCIGVDIAMRFIPGQFSFFGEQLRPTQSLINTYDQYLSISRSLRADSWVIATYERVLEELKAALKEDRAMTGTIPACPSQVTSVLTGPPSLEYRGVSNAYDKPMIFLADEFSVSFGDIFPAMMQDNSRGPIVGMRTGGWGGSISGWPAGYYSEASATNTNSLVVRRLPVSVPGMPVRPYIESLGVVPDVQIDAMTRENLMNRYRPFVDAFTQAMLNEISRARP